MTAVSTIPWWGAPLFALGGVLLTQAFNMFQDKREDRRRLQDVQRETYQTVARDLIELGNKAYSVVFNLSVWPHAESMDSEEKQQKLDDQWNTLLDLAHKCFHEVTQPLLEVGSDEIIRRVSVDKSSMITWGLKNPVFRPTAEHDKRFWHAIRAGVTGAELTSVMDLPGMFRPETAEEAADSRLQHAEWFTKELRSLAHLLRKEMGLSTSKSAGYLSLKPDRSGLKNRWRQVRFTFYRLRRRVRERLHLPSKL